MTQDIHHRTSVSDTFDRRLALCATRSAARLKRRGRITHSRLSTSMRQKSLRLTIRFSRIRTTFSALQGMRAHKTTMRRIWTR